MSLSSELKRCLELEDEPIRKRINLAENALSHPDVKDDVALKWICDRLKEETEPTVTIRLLKSLHSVYATVSSDINIAPKLTLLDALSHHIKNGDDQNDLLFSHCIRFVYASASRNPSNDFIVKFFPFMRCLFERLSNSSDCKTNENPKTINDTLKSFGDFLKKVRNKYSLIDPFINTELIWTILKLSRNANFAVASLAICQTVMFPQPSLVVFRKYLSAVLKNTELTSLIEKNGEVMRPVVLVGDLILKDLKSTLEHDRLIDLVRLVISSCKSDPALIFLFSVIIYTRLGVQQTYIDLKYKDRVAPLELVKFKVIKSVLLENLKSINSHSINLHAVCHFDTVNANGEKKTFISYLQNVITCLVCDASVLSFLIIKEAFDVDPNILHSAVDTLIGCDLIVSKKTNKNGIFSDHYDAYVLAMNNMLEVFFRMNQGSEFILKLLNVTLEKITACNEAKVNLKLTSRKEIFPDEFCISCGQLSSDLVHWQYNNFIKNTFETLNKIYSSYCNQALASHDIFFIDATCFLLHNLLCNNKMADQNINKNNFMEFYECFHGIGAELMKNLMNLTITSKNMHIVESFLQLCFIYGELELLIQRYQSKLNSANDNAKYSHLSDITLLHSYLLPKQWKDIFNQVSNENSRYHFNVLILQNTIAAKLWKCDNEFVDSILFDSKKYLLQDITFVTQLIIRNEQLTKAFIDYLDLSELKTLMETVWENVKDRKTFIMCLRKIEFNERHTVLSIIANKCMEDFWRHLEDFGCGIIGENFDVKSFLKSINKTNNSVVLGNSDTFVMVENVIESMNEIPYHVLDNDAKNILILSTFFIMINFEQFSDKCMHIMLKIFELSLKPTNIFIKIPPILFVDRLQSHILSNSLKNNIPVPAFNLIKQIILGAMTKEYIDDLEKLVKYLVEKCKSVDVDKKSLNCFKCESFHTLSIALTTMHNGKKSNMPSEMKLALNTSLDTSIEVYILFLSSIKWKHVTFDKNDNMYNILESYSIVMTHYCMKSTENHTKYIDTLKQSSHYFIEYSLNALCDTSKEYSEVRSCCHVLNVALKNINILQLDKSLFEKIWTSCETFMGQKPRSKLFESEITELIKEIVTSLCELSDVNFLRSFILSRLINLTEKQNTINEHYPHMIKTLWFCFLDANLKTEAKNEIRTSTVQRMIKNLFIQLASTGVAPTVANSTSEEFSIDDYDDEERIGNIKRNDVLDKYIFLSNVSLEIIIEFVRMKKMVIPSFIVDLIIEIPITINFDLVKSSDQTLETFFMLFNKCVMLLNKLLTHRYELLQDRWHCFLAGFRKLMILICLESDTRKVSKNNNIDKLIKATLGLERTMQLVVKIAKQDLTRIAPYTVANIIKAYQMCTVHPSVKFHCNNCINYLLEMFDDHSVGFLMRNMSDASRFIFVEIHNNYKKYHKYVGAS